MFSQFPLFTATSKQPTENPRRGVGCGLPVFDGMPHLTGHRSTGGARQKSDARPNARAGAARSLGHATGLVFVLPRRPACPPWPFLRAPMLPCFVEKSRRRAWEGRRRLNLQRRDGEERVVPQCRTGPRVPASPTVPPVRCSDKCLGGRIS